MVATRTLQDRSATRCLRLFVVGALCAIAVDGCGGGADSAPTDDGGTRVSGDGGSRGGGSTHWLVGQGGLMLAVADGAALRGYPLKTVTDLRAIACWGSSRAWVAGDGGTVLTTDD